jgi:hypothetical protein
MRLQKAPYQPQLPQSLPLLRPSLAPNQSHFSYVVSTG